MRLVFKCVVFVSPDTGAFSRGWVGIEKAELVLAREPEVHRHIHRQIIPSR